MLERFRPTSTSSRLHPRTVRLRLTAVYGGLFLICGAGLLAITYVLMSRTTSNGCYINPTGVSVCTMDGARHGGETVQTNGDAPAPFTPSQLAAFAANQHAHEMHQLLLRSGIALAIMAAASILLGWLVAGRVLRPLRRITRATQDISANNLHERLALAGPNDELKELGDTIDGLLARLEGAFDAQRRFVANASHELRTPLTVMRALLQMTLTDPEATLETFVATCEDALTEGERQERIIDALLVLARSDRGLDHREPLDLAALADNVLPRLMAEAERVGIRVDTSLAAAPTDGDPRLAEQLFTNLVENALRHNVLGGSVEIVTGTRADGAFLSVGNTGPAVPAEQIPRLFEPFQRLAADSINTSEGVGLGLSIVQAIAQAHDAMITARPREGGGLRVEVTFPGSRISSTVGAAVGEGAVGLDV